MTYVEFFDTASVRNILTALMDPPERVVLIGNSSKRMQEFIDRYKRLFADHWLAVEFIPRTASRSNLTHAVEQIEKILDEFGPCIFDITGGDEILNMALGVVYAKRPQDVKFHRITLEKNMVHDCDQDGVTIEKHWPDLTADESIAIYGGTVITGEVTESFTWLYDITEDFRESVNLMWQVCRENIRKWSRQVNTFGAAIKTGQWSADGLTVTAKRSDMDEFLLENGQVYRKEESVIEGLLDCECLTCFDDSVPGELTLGFRDLQVRRALTVAGTILELKVYLILMEADMGYTDCLTGVRIDWDGHRQDADEDYIDTDNEIDVLAMRGAVPIFISCKNGFVDADELYKLESIGRRFGGPYAKLVLVANAIPANKYGNSLRDRAKKMKIHLVEGIHKLETDEQIKEKLDHLWEIQ